MLNLTPKHTPEHNDPRWQLLRDRIVVAYVSEIRKAGTDLAFMCRDTAEPRGFQ